ncbi:fungal-specific transcription factor domain-containing protein [Xylaria sp. FL0043]|nr:fungal-specific transcription factor domain-containing protein [Xylaria sp. FL0043]
MPRACQFCRRRKIKCDAEKPQCSHCRGSNRTCIYNEGPLRQRPSASLVNSLQQEKQALERVLAQLKDSTPEERAALLDRLPIAAEVMEASTIHVSPGRAGDSQPVIDQYPTPKGTGIGENLDAEGDNESTCSDDRDGLDNISVDQGEQLKVYGATSSLHYGGLPSPVSTRDTNSEQAVRDQLIANAAIGRQHERYLHNMESIRGVPTDLALHLLDLHWNRQHHTFLLTYRPTFMRELANGGPYCSEFLLNAVFACASKYSERIEVRSDPSNPESAGQAFFARCDHLLQRDSLLTTSRIPTIIGLIMLGSTYNGRGLTSKAWLYTGYAVRMVYDLGLHQESKVQIGDAEEVEIRRRVFWGAFICEKLQGLYLGRPVFIHPRDVNVSCEFMDTYEELEPWTPYVDPMISPSRPTVPTSSRPPLTYSISVFQQFCALAKIMTKVTTKIYSVGATIQKKRQQRQNLDDTLNQWYGNLPTHLKYEPWTRRPADPPIPVAPNLTILHMVYYSLVILLHRPFASTRDFQSREISAQSWKRCSTAAKNITNLALAYRATYPLRKSSYLLSYAVYVACTIHIHNAGLGGNHGVSPDASLLGASLRCLDELAVPNSGVADTTRIVRKLMRSKGIQETQVSLEPQLVTSNNPNTSWQLFGETASIDDMDFTNPFADLGFSGQELLFGFMDDNFSPSNLL